MKVGENKIEEEGPTNTRGNPSNNRWEQNPKETGERVTHARIVGVEDPLTVATYGVVEEKMLHV